MIIKDERKELETYPLLLHHKNVTFPRDVLWIPDLIDGTIFFGSLKTPTICATIKAQLLGGTQIMAPFNCAFRDHLSHSQRKGCYGFLDVDTTTDEPTGSGTFWQVFLCAAFLVVNPLLASSFSAASYSAQFYGKIKVLGRLNCIRFTVL